MHKDIRESQIFTNNKILDNNKQLSSELQGFWAGDVWDMSQCPISQVELWSNTYRYIKFKCSNRYINTEIKYAFWKKFETRVWSIKSFQSFSIAINKIIPWLNSSDLNVYSLTEKRLEPMIQEFRDFLEERNLARYGDGYITVFRQIYQVVKEAYDDYDDIPLLDKDVWTLKDLQKLGCTIKGTQRLDFTDIQQTWLKLATKKYIKHKLSKHNTAFAGGFLSTLKTFYKFLASKYFLCQAADINRPLMVDYISYLLALPVKTNTKICSLSYLRGFLSTTARENWLNITKESLIYNDDYPKPEKNLPRFIPEPVMEQLNKNLDYLPNYIMRLTLVLQETGRRLEEARLLQFDCLTEDGHGNYYLKHFQFKMKKESRIPISPELASVIKEQQASVREEWGEDQQYLFIVPKPHGKGQAVSQTYYRQILNKMAYERDIRDSNGKLWRFQAHQFRHTVGTRMINAGVPQYIVQRYLGHESPRMTMVYAHIHDETMRKEIEKYHETRVVNFQGETAKLDETVLSSNDDLEWFKKNVQARALEHGYCARPKVLGNCDIPGFDGCYNCPHWRTNKNFLPVLKDTLERTNKVLEKANNCGWQLQVNKNAPIKENLEKVIKSLEADND